MGEIEFVVKGLLLEKVRVRLLHGCFRLDGPEGDLEVIYNFGVLFDLKFDFFFKVKIRSLYEDFLELVCESPFETALKIGFQHAKHDRGGPLFQNEAVLCFGVMEFVDWTVLRVGVYLSQDNQRVLEVRMEGDILHSQDLQIKASTSILDPGFLVLGYVLKLSLFISVLLSLHLDCLRLLDVLIDVVFDDLDTLSGRCRQSPVFDSAAVAHN